MSRTIRVSDDVYRRLQEEATPFEDTPDSVLRRLLGMEASVPSSDGPGELLPYVEHGRIAAGDELCWERPRRGERHLATVTGNGEIELSDGRRFTSPSGAAVAVAGGNHNGWNMWVHTASGRKLQEIREA